MRSARAYALSAGNRKTAVEEGVSELRQHSMKAQVAAQDILVRRQFQQRKVVAHENILLDTA